jgi:hypothetical protein
MITSKQAIQVKDTRQVETESLAQYGNTYQRLKSFDSCIIIARRWFNRRVANTYHSVLVIVDGVEVGRNDYEYGYGDQYIATAHKLLQAAGFYAKTGISARSGVQIDRYLFQGDMMDNRQKFTVTVTDVQRKKDL